MQFVQCFPLYHAPALKRLVSYALNSGAEILLDLEDSVDDLSSTAAGLICKQNARKTLLELYEFLIELQMEAKIHVRINAVDSIHFMADIECIAGLTGLEWESIFVPKIRCDEDLFKAAQKLRSSHILFKYLSPIAETLEGVNYFLNHFPRKTHKIKTVFFGNYDYNLSCGNYPLIEQDHELYWSTVIPLINSVERAGLIFGNSPYAALNDSQTFIASILRLKTICKTGFYQCCLNLEQTKIAKKINNGCSVKELMLRGNELDTNANDEFAHYHLEGRSFAYNPLQNRITTPHEYLLWQKNSFIQ